MKFLNKIKDLYEKYNEWCLEEVNIDFGFYHLSTNNYTVYMLPIGILAFIILAMSKGIMFPLIVVFIILLIKN